MHKTAAALFALLLASAGIASAGTTTVVHISGATTYRAPVHQAICQYLASNYSNTFKFACDNSDGYKQNYAIYYATSGGNVLVIDTYWTGSVSGVYDVAARNTLTNKYLNSADATTLASNSFAGFDGSGAGGVGNTGAPLWAGSPNTLTSATVADTDTENAAPDVVLSDSFTTSAAASVATALAGATSGVTAKNSINNGHLTAAGSAAATAGTVGIVPFVWVIGNNSATGTTGTCDATNIQKAQALALITNGSYPLMFLSGNTADQYTFLAIVGRNEDSGSRVCAFAEAGYGFGAAPNQFQLSFNGASQTSESGGTGNSTGGSASTVTAFALWPANYPLNTETAINWGTLGHSGYVGGGDVKNVLSAKNPVGLAADSVHTTATGTIVDNGDNLDASATGVYFIGYLGTADSATTNGLTLSYDGVPFGINAIYNGQYTFWAYEHMYYVSSGHTGAPSAAQKSVIDAIADLIYATPNVNNNDGTGGFSVFNSPSASVLQAGVPFNSSVLTTRSAEGATISPNY